MESLSFSSAIVVLGAAAALLAGCGPRGERLGQQIYQQGAGASGQLAFSQGPDWLRFVDANCAVCHGLDGRGLAMQAGDVAGAAPAVTWTALTMRGYDAQSLRQALAEGVTPDSRVLSYYMPRWVLSDAEAAALAAYLASL